MVSGGRYRVVSAGGCVVITALAAWLANYVLLQEILTSYAPILNRLYPRILSGDSFLIAVGTTLVVVTGSLTPLFKPRPRRILDTIMLTQKRVVISGLALASIGYFDYTYRLPRTTLILVTAVLLFALPMWFVSIRRQPGAEQRAIIVGDDKEAMTEVFEASTLSVVGYVSPHSPFATDNAGRDQPRATDGGTIIDVRSLGELPFLGGLANLDEVLIEHDIDTALLAFSGSDRAEFFGALDTCYDHGVSAKVHRNHADTVLINGTDSEEIVDVELEPLDWQDYAIKRFFDIAFAGIGLVVLSPMILVIAIAIKLDSPGPVLYSQNRTAEFGETFTVYKFRSMIPDAEAETGATLSNEDAGETDPRVTRVGRVLRRTHLDEIPQLWAVLTGDMSVVGPRPERPELDADIEQGVVDWRRRWFVKPGLTGLAQINDVTGFEPEQKLRYDIEYIREQSFWLDLKIVIRQIWIVVGDVVALLRDKSG